MAYNQSLAYQQPSHQPYYNTRAAPNPSSAIQNQGYGGSHGTYHQETNPYGYEHPQGYGAQGHAQYDEPHYTNEAGGSGQRWNGHYERNIGDQAYHYRGYDDPKTGAPQVPLVNQRPDVRVGLPRDPRDYRHGASRSNEVAPLNVQSRVGQQGVRPTPGK
jgi:hypothetical protein